MALNVLPFFTPWTIFLIALIVVIGAIIILTIIERKLNKKIYWHKIEEENSLQKKIDLLKKSQLSPNKLLVIIDNIAREYFEKKFKLKKDTKYSTLTEFFLKNNESAERKFCERMQEALYAGENLNIKRLSFLLDNLEFLVTGGRPAIEKETIDKKEKTVPIEIIKTESNVIKSTPEEEKEINKIKEYVSQGLKRRFSINFLRKKLIEGGFNDKEIIEAVRRLKEADPSSSEIREEEPQNLKEGKRQPYNKVEVNYKSVKSPKDYKNVRAFDDFDRLEYKINRKKDGFSESQDQTLI